jgi:hypothetical protein
LSILVIVLSVYTIWNFPGIPLSLLPSILSITYCLLFATSCSVKLYYTPSTFTDIVWFWFVPISILSPFWLNNRYLLNSFTAVSLLSWSLSVIPSKILLICYNILFLKVPSFISSETYLFIYTGIYLPLGSLIAKNKCPTFPGISPSAIATFLFALNPASVGIIQIKSSQPICLGFLWESLSNSETLLCFFYVSFSVWCIKCPGVILPIDKV